MGETITATFLQTTQKSGPLKKWTFSNCCKKDWTNFIPFVVKLIGHFERGKESVGVSTIESALERVIEKQLNLRHRCIAAPIGFVVSGNGAGDGDGVELRTVRPFMESGSLADILACPPPRWTATAKAIAVTGLALGLRFAHGVGLVHGALTPGSVLLDEALEIQIAGIRAIRRGSADAEFTAPEVLRDGERTTKADVFSFARIVSRIVADDRPSVTVLRFVSRLMAAGLSADPSVRPSFGRIIAKLRSRGFAVVSGVDRLVVLAFVRAAEEAAP
jgi:serine/threonine protein kinase